MITSDRILKLVISVYLGLFFTYMFLPLGYMMLAAFNASSFPTISPWKGFTGRWFVEAWNDRSLARALWTSLLVGAAVVMLSVPLGLAGAFLMNSLQIRARNLLFAIFVSPVLTPGIVIGLSTVIFWNQIASVHGSWTLSVLGQSSFVSAYCMLIFGARLQRFDVALEEAARDLGASPIQVFTTIMLPYLRPAVFSSAALSFMQSLENFNTTLFTIGNDLTLTIYMAGKIKSGVTPVINAIACVMVAVTVAGGILYELARRRERLRAMVRQQWAAQATSLTPMAVN
jgi:spermidine/putrescine transport system permease protein